MPAKVKDVGMLALGFGDCQDGRVYWDGHNYRVRRESYVEVAGIMCRVLSSRGPIPQWNRAVKAEFPSVHDFYEWATKGHERQSCEWCSHSFPNHEVGCGWLE